MIYNNDESIFRYPVQHQHVKSIAIAEFENLHNLAVHIILLRHLLRFYYTSHYQGKFNQQKHNSKFDTSFCDDKGLIQVYPAWQMIDKTKNNS